MEPVPEPEPMCTRQFRYFRSGSGTGFFVHVYYYLGSSFINILINRLLTRVLHDLKMYMVCTNQVKRWVSGLINIDLI